MHQPIDISIEVENRDLRTLASSARLAGHDVHVTHSAAARCAAVCCRGLPLPRHLAGSVLLVPARVRPPAQLHSLNSGRRIIYLHRIRLPLFARFDKPTTYGYARAYSRTRSWRTGLMTMQRGRCGTSTSRRGMVVGWECGRCCPTTSIRRTSQRTGSRSPRRTEREVNPVSPRVCLRELFRRGRRCSTSTGTLRRGLLAIGSAWGG